jgi:nucleoside permease NupC
MEVLIFELVFWLIIAPIAFLIGVLLSNATH